MRREVEKILGAKRMKKMKAVDSGGGGGGGE